MRYRKQEHLELLDRATARERGLTRFFTGRPCKHGHVAERVTSSGLCTQCRRERQRKWQQANPEKVLAAFRRYYAAHPEKIGKFIRKWQAKHPETQVLPPETPCT